MFKTSVAAKSLRSLLLTFICLLFAIETHSAEHNSCWREIELGESSRITLSLNDDSGILRYSNNVNTQVERHKKGHKGERYGVLSTDGGTLFPPEGDWYIHTDVLSFKLAKGASVRRKVSLQALQGTKIQMHDPLQKQTLPAGELASVPHDNKKISAVLENAVFLVPESPQSHTSRLEVGTLPISQGGRTIEVDIFAPGVPKSEIESEVFQSCFVGSKVATTLAHVVEVTDNHAKLNVPVPDDFGSGAGTHEKYKLQILGSTLGTLSNEEIVYLTNPYWAFIGSLLLVAAILYAISKTMPIARTEAFYARLFRFVDGIDGQPSLSLFQISIWTILLLTGMIYVFFMSGDLINVTQQVLVLVGMAGMGSLSARIISTSRTSAVDQRANGFWGMFLSNGVPDLVRLQLFLFTVAIWVYVAARVFYEQQFPELEVNVLLLMGISNGVYIGGKWANNENPETKVRIARGEKLYFSEQLENKKGRLSEIETKIAQFTQSRSAQPTAENKKQHDQLVEQKSTFEEDISLLETEIEKSQQRLEEANEQLLASKR